ncbi:hypothetical protein BGZ98_001635 [Dissophora globulifera]|nr:hypothetical protein BGZ98_001635 [Dissophora globulifera]
MSLLRGLRQRTANPRLAATVPATALALSAPPSLATLAPELLENIFSYLSQHYLRSTIALVCREWHHVAGLLVVRTFRCTSDTPDSGIDSATVLICGTRASSPFYRRQPSTSRAPTWENLAHTLESLKQQGRLHIKTLMHSMENVAISWGPAMTLLVPLGSSLTTLRLDEIPENTSIPWRRILETCPGLLHLGLHGAFSYEDFARLETPYSDSTGSEDSTVFNQFGDAGAATQGITWRLRSCTLEGFILPEPALYSFVEACPNLQELQLKSVKPVRGPAGKIQAMLYVPAKRLAFYQFLASHCPNLDSLHLSLVKADISDSGALSTLFPHHMFPKIKHWSLDVTSMMPPMFAFLTIHQIENHLTTLEILGETPKHREWDPEDEFMPVGPEAIVGELLHRFLCRSPSLLHLKAIGVNMKLTALQEPSGESMFDYISEGNIPSEIQSKPTPQLWACRHLKTLHMRSEKDDSHHMDDKGSLALYGYISRVCPELEDLSIHRNALTIGAESGLCLLTRLRKLRRLQIVMLGTIREVRENEMDWIQRQYYSLNSLTEKTMLERIEYKRLQQEEEDQKRDYQLLYLGQYQGPEKPNKILSKISRRMSAIYRNEGGMSKRTMVEGVDMTHWGEAADITPLFNYNVH